MSRLVVVFVAFFLAVGCGEDKPRPQWESQEISGVITDVRYASTYQASKSSEALGGALVGGILFGTAGAILGAAAGSDSAQEGKVEVLGCRFSVRFPNGETRIFYIDTFYREYVWRCVLLKEGDKELFVLRTLGSERRSYQWHRYTQETPVP